MPSTRPGYRPPLEDHNTQLAVWVPNDLFRALKEKARSDRRTLRSLVIEALSGQLEFSTDCEVG